MPNRWLVTRRRSGAGGVEKQWVVESDYLVPEGRGGPAGGVSYPFFSTDTVGRSTDASGGSADAIGCQPLRHLGRTLPRAAWKAKNGGEPKGSGTKDGDQYLDPLIAVGYGEPSFAAFHPNCHNVFGFHDDDTAGDDLTGLRYEVVGWYGRKEQDPLNALWREQPDEIEDPLAAIEKAFDWSFTFGAGKQAPETLCCYARLTFEPEDPAMGNPEPTTIALGNTGTGPSRPTWRSTRNRTTSRI